MRVETLRDNSGWIAKGKGVFGSYNIPSFTACIAT